MYKEYADFALDFLKKKNVDYGEVRLEEHDGDAVLLKNGAVEISGFDNSIGMGIRFLTKNSLGFVAINQFDKIKIKNVLEKGLRLVKKGSKLSDHISLSNEKIYKKKYKVYQKVKLNDVGIDEKIKLLSDVDNCVEESLGRYLSLTTGTTKKYLITTEGARINSEIPLSNFFGVLTVEVNGRTAQRHLQFGNKGGYEFIRKWRLAEVLSDEYKVLRESLEKAERYPKGKIDLVVGPEITGIMVHESVGHPLEADRIFGREAAQAGESFVHRDMVGTKYGSEHVSIVDDPTLENSPGFYLFDDEGVKTRRRILVKNGIVNEFLHNRETAAVMGVKSNGAARAENYDKEVIVRMGNTFLLPGSYSWHELIENIKLGVYMKSFTEWNIDDKRYQQKYVGSEAYLIKNGKLKHPIFRPVIEITTPALWNSIDAVGRKLKLDCASCGKGEPMQGAPVNLGGPVMRIRDVRLS